MNVFVFYHHVIIKIGFCMQPVRIWAKSNDADVIVFSETWLSKSVFDKDICIRGYNVYRTDWVKKGGGVAIYVKI
jgi:exonuclease III